MAVLVIDASKGEFEKAFTESFKNHSLILSFSRISQMIIAVNKMDKVKYFYLFQIFSIFIILD